VVVSVQELEIEFDALLSRQNGDNSFMLTQARPDRFQELLGSRLREIERNLVRRENLVF
jgi:hypothetical protein